MELTIAVQIPRDIFEGIVVGPRGFKVAILNSADSESFSCAVGIRAVENYC